MLAVLAVVAAACGSGSLTSPARSSPPPAGNATLPIIAGSRLNAGEIVAWFNAGQARTSGVYAATVAVEDLARYFIEEGAAEGVTGDIAFMQSVVETGWFRFAGAVPAAFNNFAGIGATDTQPTPAVFPDARTGVRAQIQHLRAYGDSSALTCTVPPLANSCVDPRFHLVAPKGKAPTWNQMGNGNWATAPTYAESILSLYREALTFNGLQ